MKNGTRPMRRMFLRMATAANALAVSREARADSIVIAPADYPPLADAYPTVERV